MDKKKSINSKAQQKNESKGMCVRIFSKDAGDYNRFWASVSSPIIKDGAETGEYYQANISVRMSKDACMVFDDVCEPTHNKDVAMAWVRLTDYWLKAVGGQDKDYVVLFVNRMEEVE